MDFSDLESYYPGSRETRQTVASLPASAVDDDLLGTGKMYPVNGRDVEFFTIGQLARAIGRQPGTLRKWESTGIIPKPLYTTKYDDIRGKRRLYTRKQAEGIIRIAMETGVMYADERRPLDEFGRQVRKLFEDLKGAR